MFSGVNGWDVTVTELIRLGRIYAQLIISRAKCCLNLPLRSPHTQKNVHSGCTNWANDH